MHNQKRFQSTLSVRRATRLDEHVADKDMISIHALRKESDIACERIVNTSLISIHALRKESDRA